MCVSCWYMYHIKMVPGIMQMTSGPYIILLGQIDKSHLFFSWDFTIWRGQVFGTLLPDTVIMGADGEEWRMELCVAYWAYSSSSKLGALSDCQSQGAVYMFSIYTEQVV